MRILFVDCTGTVYDGTTAASLPLGGIEGATFELSRMFAARGHRVSVANACAAPVTSQGVDWYPKARLPAVPADIVIVNNNPSLLNIAAPALRSGAKPIVWLHNQLSIEKMIRKGDLWSLLRYRPSLVASGRYQIAMVNRALPLRSRDIIPLGVAPLFTTAEMASRPPGRRAVFVSQPYRGFAESVRLWIERVRPRVSDAELVAFVGRDAECGYSDETLVANGVIRRDRVTKDILVGELRAARFMLCPGHPAETFCLAAAEALCVGTPVVTRGIGALSERVRDGVDGVIARSDAPLAEAMIGLFEKEALWHRLHEGALEARATMSWGRIAERWEAVLA